MSYPHTWQFYLLKLLVIPLDNINESVEVFESVDGVQWRVSEEHDGECLSV